MACPVSVQSGRDRAIRPSMLERERALLQSLKALNDLAGGILRVYQMFLGCLDRRQRGGCEGQIDAPEHSIAHQDEYRDRTGLLRRFAVSIAVTDSTDLLKKHIDARAVMNEFFIRFC